MVITATIIIRILVKIKKCIIIIITIAKVILQNNADDCSIVLKENNNNILGLYISIIIINNNNTKSNNNLQLTILQVIVIPVITLICNIAQSNTIKRHLLVNFRKELAKLNR